MGRFKHYLAMAIGYPIAAVIFVSIVYGSLFHDDPLWVPVELALSFIDGVLMGIYGCNGPRVPTLCPR
jgi:hypothetical protein